MNFCTLSIVFCLLFPSWEGIMYRAFGPVEPQVVWHQYPLIEQLTIHQNSRPDAKKKYCITLNGKQLFTDKNIEPLCVNNGQWRQGTPSALVLELRGDTLVICSDQKQEEIHLLAKENVFSYAQEKQAIESLQDAFYLEKDRVFSDAGERLYFPLTCHLLPINQDSVYHYNTRWSLGSLQNKPLMKQKSKGVVHVYGCNGAHKNITLSQPKPKFGPLEDPSFVALSKQRFLLKLGKASFLVRPKDMLYYEKKAWRQVANIKEYNNIKLLQDPCPLLIIENISGEGDNKKLHLILLDPYRQFSKDCQIGYRN